MNINTDALGNTISSDVAASFIDSVTPDMVVSVYSGKSGCMCGCRGNYRYNPAYRPLLDVSEEKHFSSRSVTLILNKLKKSGGAAIDNGTILHFDDVVRDRQYVVYLEAQHALNTGTTR